MTTSTPEAAGLTMTADGRVDGRSARKVETRRRIIRAASDLFAEQGFSGTSMDQIADRAGVSKGTIFYNFKNKNDLSEQLVRHAATVIAEQIESARKGLEGWDALSHAIMTVMVAVKENPSHAQILITELFRMQRPWAGSLAESREILMGPIAAILKELGVRRQELLGARILSEEAAANVAMSLIGAVVVATLDQLAYFPDRRLEDAHAVLMQSISGMKI